MLEEVNEGFIDEVFDVFIVLIVEVEFLNGGVVMFINFMDDVIVILVDLVEDMYFMFLLLMSEFELMLLEVLFNYDFDVLVFEVLWFNYYVEVEVKGFDDIMLWMFLLFCV